MVQVRIRLGQLLVDARILTAQQLEQVLAQQKTDGRRLGTLLVEAGYVSETQLTQILSQQFSVPWASLHHIDFSRQLLNLVPRQVAEKYCLVPIYVRHVRHQGETLYVAMDDPTNEEALAECAHWSGLPARAMIASPSDIRSAIRVYYGATTSLAPRNSSSQPAAAAIAPVEAPAPPVKPAAVEPARAPMKATVPSVPAPPPPIASPAPAPVAASAVVAVPRSASPPESDAPELEVREIEIPRPARGKIPRMLSLTLLDGTQINLPAARRRAKGGQAGDSGADAPPSKTRPAEASQPPPSQRESQPPDSSSEQLTARDLVAALRAVSHGADADEILGENTRWEKMFAALLSVLLRKHLIADWEFIDEFKKI